MNREVQCLLYFIGAVLSEEDLAILDSFIERLSVEANTDKGEEDLRVARDIFAGTLTSQKGSEPQPDTRANEIRRKIRELVEELRSQRRQKTTPEVEVTSRYHRIIQNISNRQSNDQ
jgi:hypothetical protein